MMKDIYHLPHLPHLPLLFRQINFLKNFINKIKQKSWKGQKVGGDGGDSYIILAQLISVGNRSISAQRKYNKPGMTNYLNLELDLE